MIHSDAAVVFCSPVDADVSASEPAAGAVDFAGRVAGCCCPLSAMALKSCWSHCLALHLFFGWFGSGRVVGVCCHHRYDVLVHQRQGL